ncbi:S9 family peptidase [Actinomyces sp.]|uniref:alpha/beta hydrolase family protein n=1 Tax=Actinomyces sp. TaxID=29317 RepID=UPI0026DBF01D|nr:prolyl oligopeptidase family serine peptidase [Actinomyces sp.]MDO4901062.1 prolyl oligopeptidase family serine peptidase [Actinomyces sp.]
MTARVTGLGPGEEHPEAIGGGLGCVEVHTLTDARTGVQVRLEQPIHPATTRPRKDLLRHRGIAYDRIGGDFFPAPVPEGCLGIIEPDGKATLLAETAQGLPCWHGEHGWVYCQRQGDGQVQVSMREHMEAHPVGWGASTRSLLGLRPNNAGPTRLWRLGRHVIWLRQEYPACRTIPRHSTGEETWPDAIVEDLFCAGACTVMMDDAPLPGLPAGAVVLLEAEDSLILGIAATTTELAVFLAEDHVNHYVVSATSQGDMSESSPIGDLPRTSVAHRDTGDARAVVFTERLPGRTTSYTVEDGTVIATLEESVDHYTGVPGLNGAWVERRRPDTVHWPGGWWSDGTEVERLLPGDDRVGVRVITERTHGCRQIAITPDQAGGLADPDAIPPVSANAAPTAYGRRESASRPSRVLWVPPVDDPVLGTSASVVARSALGHEVESITSESAQGATPLVWFDSSWTVPGLAPHLTRIDIGSLPVGSAQWSHAGSRPVVRVGIDYEALARTDTDGIVNVLTQAWQAALNVIAETLPGNTGTPFLGGHSFGAALAAVAVLRDLVSPAGVILRSGAYDRYATPGGFEHDRRTAASAPDLYRLMTVVSRAREHQGIPFLITCGGDDENSATTPRQSQTLYENLTLCGADATLAVFAGEGHVFAARQSILEQRRLEAEWMSERAGKTNADSQCSSQGAHLQHRTTSDSEGQ